MWENWPQSNKKPANGVVYQLDLFTWSRYSRKLCDSPKTALLTLSV